MALDSLLNEVRDCTLCSKHLPLGPHPTLGMKKSAQIIIIGQAPGTKAHKSGIPWNDQSGNRLREWMNIDRETFYDTRRIAIMPMGFCYPGRLERNGDKPPRPECAPEWHARLLAELPNVELTLLVGMYAQAYYLPESRAKTLTATVKQWRNYLPGYIPTPHPSWRTTGWQKNNPWFEAELLPVLREEVCLLL